MKTVNIVLGLGFGDEGKGLTTSALTLKHKNENPAVIRFNGGPQAGHTVMTKLGQRHVFSHIGSGALHGAPTIWMKDCPFNPKALVTEYMSLKTQTIKVPPILINPFSPLITEFELRHDLNNAKPGYSCATGIAPTLERRSKTPFQLFACDLNNLEVLEHKLQEYKKYLKKNHIIDYPLLDKEVIHKIMNVVDIDNFDEEEMLYDNSSTIIFEGAQGILLDKTYGIFPYVTRSNCNIQNIIPYLKDTSVKKKINIYFVTRAYQTRHGNGPLLYNEKINCGEITSFNKETNVTNKYQGEFRKEQLSFDALLSAISTTQYLLAENHITVNKENIVVTHLDNVSNKSRVIKILSQFGTSIIESYSPYTEDLKI